MATDESKQIKAMTDLKKAVSDTSNAADSLFSKFSKQSRKATRDTTNLSNSFKTSEM